MHDIDAFALGWVLGDIPAHDPCNPRIEQAAVHLTPGKLSAVRAAFKVGVKPTQIARQFDLSQSDVPQALASGASR
jgi:hypothetical protein